MEQAYYLYFYMIKNYVFVLAVAPILSGISACNGNQQSLKAKQDNVQNGKIDETYNYECKELGWKTSLPKDWNILTKQESESLNERGKSAIEQSVGKKIDVSGLKELVNLKKDPYNTFISTMEAFNEKTDGKYEDKNKEVVELIKDTYKSKGIKFDIKEGTEKIDGLEFYTIDMAIYTPGADSKILMNQKMYNRLLNGNDFAMTITYNNPKDSTTQANIVYNSKFTIRN